MNTLPVVAVIKAKPGKQQELERVLRSLISPTLKETGCIQYDLHRVTHDSHTFVFIEKWTSAEALKQHLESSHIQAAFARQEEFIADLQVLSLNPLM